MSAAPIAICPPPGIECSPQLMEELRRASGAPVNGLLWGQLRGNRLFVKSWTPCGESGRSLRTAFRRRLRSGPPLPGLQCVGWVFSRETRDARLTVEERALFDACFPEPWQTGLVIGPGFQIDFLFRDSPRAPVPLPRPAAPAPVLMPSARRVRYSPWAAAALVLTGVMAGGAWASSESKPVERREPLRIAARDAAWEIRWDRRGLDSLQGTRLEVSEGSRTLSRRLSDQEIRAGLVTVPVTLGDLRVALFFERPGGAPLEEHVLVVGKSGQPVKSKR